MLPSNVTDDAFIVTGNKLTSNILQKSRVTGSTSHPQANHPLVSGQARCLSPLGLFLFSCAGKFSPSHIHTRSVIIILTLSAFLTQILSARFPSLLFFLCFPCLCQLFNCFWAFGVKAKDIKVRGFLSCCTSFKSTKNPLKSLQHSAGVQRFGPSTVFHV